MNAEKIINQLMEKYPGKKIVMNKAEDGKVVEILCEIESTSVHPEWSLAIVIADRSKSHKHLKTTESYKVTKSTLKVFIDGEEKTLHEGDSVTIEPGQVHYVTGDETWFECKSEPGWTIEDHIFEKQE